MAKFYSFELSYAIGKLWYSNDRFSQVNNGQSWMATTSESPQIYQRTSASSFMILVESAQLVKNLIQYQSINNIFTVFEKLIDVNLFSDMVYMVIFSQDKARLDLTSDTNDVLRITLNGISYLIPKLVIITNYLLTADLQSDRIEGQFKGSLVVVTFISPFCKF